MTASPGNRVLMLLENCSYPRDGRVRREAQTLLAAGYEVAVIAPGNPGQPARETVRGVRVYRYRQPAGGEGLWSYLWEYGFALTATAWLSLVALCSQGFDIVHAHNPPDLFVVVGLFYKLLGKKFIFDHHDLSPEMYYARFGGGNRWVHRALLFFEKLSFRAADHVITTNHSYRAIAQERGQVPAERITVVRNGPELDRVTLASPDEELRRRASTIIGYVGVMGFQDGIDYLLRALRHLVHDLGRTDFFCVLIGEGDAYQSLRRLASELELDEHVWFTGFVSDEDLMRYLSTADILVDPDPKNPFNDRSTMIKIVEYMTLGKPIVAFDLTEHRYTAQDSALYAQPNDELDFARQLARLIDEPELRAELGRRGRERIENQLAWVHQEPMLLAAYDKLAGRETNDASRLQTAETNAAAP